MWGLFLMAHLLCTDMMILLTRNDTVILVLFSLLCTDMIIFVLCSNITVFIYLIFLLMNINLTRACLFMKITLCTDIRRANGCTCSIFLYCAPEKLHMSFEN